ncbi:MAG TPA: hypothetical protein ENK13_02755, partial [Thermopetrobacter sp.]|nr:hypothetical protein [Thermopetrobacter sp.]
MPRPGPGPELVPPRKTPGRRFRWAALALIAGGLGAAIWWQLRTQPQTGGPGGGAAPGIPTAVVENRRLERVLRLTGTTAAERYVNIVSPRLRGSRSRRGLQTGGRVGIAANVTVRSTSSVATQATMSSLSQTGVVTSSSAAAARGGGVSGGGGGAQNTRLQAATSRVRTGGGSTGNVQLAGAAGTTAMGASGLGSTANFLTGGSSGPPARRRRGDFHLQLQKLVPAGTRVKKGDIIAVFDRQYMLTRLDDYAAAVAMHKANYEKSRAEIEVKRKAHTESVDAARAGLEKAELDIKTIPVLSAIQAERTRLAREEAEAEYRRRL